MLESIAGDHLVFMSNLDVEIFAFILETLHDGLTALGETDDASVLLYLVADTAVCTACCSTLDLIVTYLYKRVSRPAKVRVQHAAIPPEGDNCLLTIERHPNIMRQVIYLSTYRIESVTDAIGNRQRDGIRRLS